MSDEELTRLLDNAVSEPPHAIEVAAVVRVGRAQRRHRQMAVGLSALMIAIAIVAPMTLHAVHNASSPTGPNSRNQLCDAPPPGVSITSMPNRVRIATIVDCDTRLVRRPGDGVWLEETESHATVVGAAYGNQIKKGGGGLQCGTPSGPRAGGDPAFAKIAVGSDGRAYRIDVRFCSPDLNGLAAALQDLVWQRPTTRWLARMLSEANSHSACAQRWLEVGGLPHNYLASAFNPTGSHSSPSSAIRVTPSQYCAVWPLDPSTPGPGNLLVVNRLDGAQQATVNRALSAVTGSFSMSRKVAMPSSTRGQPCSSPPAKDSWSVKADGRLLGYIGLDACTRAIGADLKTHDANLTKFATVLGYQFM